MNSLQPVSFAHSATLSNPDNEIQISKKGLRRFNRHRPFRLSRFTIPCSKTSLSGVFKGF